MIYCCGGYHTPDKVVSLLPTFRHRDRKLEVLVCPSCGGLVAELVQYNVRTREYETLRPKKKKVKQFIADVKSGKFDEVKVQHGTKQSAGYIFGVNKEAKDGKIYQYAVDFNGNKKLVKIIE